MVQGKTEKALYKGMSTTIKSEEEYIVVEGTHEAIISKELYGKVQKIFERTGAEVKARKEKLEPVEKPENFYDELFVCADCGRKMGLRLCKVRKRRHPIYICNSANVYGKRCKCRAVYKSVVDRTVESFLRQQISVYMGCVEQIRTINASPARIRELSDLKTDISKTEEKAEALAVKIGKLYEDFSDGILSEEDYLFAKKIYLNEQERLADEISEKKLRSKLYEKTFAGDGEMADMYQKHNSFEVLSKEVVRDLIEKINYYGKGRYEIKLRYEDELQILMSEIEGRGDGCGE